MLPGMRVLHDVRVLWISLVANPLPGYEFVRTAGQPGTGSDKGKAG